MPEHPAEEPAHDVLAAEAFAMPAPDPLLDHRPVRLPDDPTGIVEPHDVLAAEEFPMPAIPPRSPGRGQALARAGGPWPLTLVLLLGGALILFRFLRKRATHV